MICTAGGFERCNFDDEGIFDLYHHIKISNIYSSLLLTNLAIKYAKKDGLVIYTGADEVYTDPKPELLIYVLS